MGWLPHAETFTCAMKGHVAPAASVARLRPEDSGIGVDLPDGRRLARCLRCDAWLASPSPEAPEAETLPPLLAIELPPRGKALHDAIVLKIIAVDRAIHSVVFGLLAAGSLAIFLHLGGFRSQLRKWTASLDRAIGSTQGTTTPGFLSRELHKLLSIQSNSLREIFVVAGLYCLVEGTEAVGLWLGRRWAEYLTAVATAGFLPLEISDLLHKVSVLRLGTLVVNLAILAWLVWKKRLFGLERRWPLRREEIDVLVLLAPGSTGTPIARA